MCVALSVRPVFTRFMMFIVALLQSVLSGISRQKLAPGSGCRRMFVSPVVCVIGSVMCVSAHSVRPVFAWSVIMMFIVALLQSVLFGILRQKFALRSWCRRKFVSPKVCVCALCSPGVRSVYNYDIYCGVVTIGLVRDFAPEIRARKFVSPEVCVAGSLCRRELCWAVRGPQFGDASCIVRIRGSQSTI